MTKQEKLSLALLISLIFLEWPGGGPAVLAIAKPVREGATDSVGSYISESMTPVLFEALQKTPRTAVSLTPLPKGLLSLTPATLVVEVQSCRLDLEQVVLKNIGDSPLVVTDVYSDFSMIHPLAVEVQAIEPGGSLTFQVAIVAQRPGSFSGLVIVQTSLGSAQIAVSLTATANQYGLEEIVSEVVADERFAWPISLFNPNSFPVTIEEALTSGHMLLQRPIDHGWDDGKGGKDRDAWTLGHQQRKVVAKVSLLERSNRTHTGFVYLRSSVGVFAVPVQINVKTGGVHVSPEVLDFMTFVAPKQQRHISLWVSNMNSQPIELLSLYDQKQDKSIQISFEHRVGARVRVAPQGSVRFAKVTYTSGVEGSIEGKLQLIINDTDSVSATLDVPYKARILYGSLGVLNDKTQFLATPGKIASTSRPIVVSNNFSVPVVVHSASISDPSFKISGFKPDRLLLPGEAVELLQVKFTSNGSSSLYTQDLDLQTNMTPMKISLQVYHGRLHCQKEGVEEIRECGETLLDLDLGTMGVGEKRRKSVNIINMNPVNVTIDNVMFTDSALSLHLEGIWGPEGTQVQGGRPLPQSALTKKGLSLAPGHRMRLAIEAVPSEAGVSSSTYSLVTKRKDVINIEVRYESILGGLTFLPAALRFEAAFPGRVRSRVVAARSTFERPLQILNLRSTDSRVIPQLWTKTLQPLARTEVAVVYYDPSKFSTPGENLGPPKDDVEWDVPLTEEVVERWARRQKLWDDLGANAQTTIEAELLFDTNIVMGASLAVLASLMKPQIILEPSLNFDLTQVGNTVVRMLDIHNPSDTPLAAQLVFPCCDASASDIGPCDRGFKLSPQAQQVVYVKPNSMVSVGPIIFEPSHHAAYNTTLYVRNNLTSLHPVRLQGVGGSGRLIFQDGALDFNLTAEDFLEEEAEISEVAVTPRPLSITKSFRATNDCELPVEVIGMDIDGMPGCQGYGFRINDCQPFVVAAHETVSISVSFVPDIPASCWEQRLRLLTASGPHAVLLRAFVPSELVPLLATRGPYIGDAEASMKKAATVLSILVFIAMLVIVVLDATQVGETADTTGSQYSGSELLKNSGKRDMVSLLTWPGVDALAPSSSYSYSWPGGGVRRSRQRREGTEAAREPHEAEEQQPPQRQPQVQPQQQAVTPDSRSAFVEAQIQAQQQHASAAQAVKAMQALQQAVERAHQAAENSFQFHLQHMADQTKQVQQVTGQAPRADQQEQCTQPPTAGRQPQQQPPQQTGASAQQVKSTPSAKAAAAAPPSASSAGPAGADSAPKGGEKEQGKAARANAAAASVSSKAASEKEDQPRKARGGEEAVAEPGSTGGKRRGGSKNEGPAATPTSASPSPHAPTTEDGKKREDAKKQDRKDREQNQNATPTSEGSGASPTTAPNTKGKKNKGGDKKEEVVPTLPPPSRAGSGGGEDGHSSKGREKPTEQIQQHQQQKKGQTSTTSASSSSVAASQQQAFGRGGEERPSQDEPQRYVERVLPAAPPRVQEDHYSAGSHEASRKAGKKGEGRGRTSAQKGADDWQQWEEQRERHHVERVLPAGSSRDDQASTSSTSANAKLWNSKQQEVTPKRGSVEKGGKAPVGQRSKDGNQGRVATEGGAGDGSRSSAGGGGAASSSAPGLCVWTDPKPMIAAPAAAYSYWELAPGLGLPPGIQGDLLDSAGGKMSLPPPPSMPPPPAPLRQGRDRFLVPKHQQHSITPASTSEQVHLVGAHHGLLSFEGSGGKRGDSPTAADPSAGEGTASERRNRWSFGSLAPVDHDPRSAWPDRFGPVRAPIGPPSPIGTGDLFPERLPRGLLPDQEFIPINTVSALDRMQVFGDSPFQSSFFSPFSMFGPVTGYGVDVGSSASAGGGGVGDLLADLHADSQPIENELGRHKMDGHKTEGAS